MTINEARNKRCPVSSTSRWLMQCVADQCMMWRWKQELVCDNGCDVIVNEAGNNEFVPRLANSETDGYCGLAGKEGAE